MNINLNDKNIIKIVYQLNDGSKVNFHYKNGELMTIDNVNDEYKSTIRKQTDKKTSKISDFLNKTWTNLKKGCKTKNKKKENLVGLQNAQELIKMEVDGRMDDLVKQKQNYNKKLFESHREKNEKVPYDSIDEN